MKLLLAEKLLKQIFKKYYKRSQLKMHLHQENDSNLVIYINCFLLKFHKITELFFFIE